MATGEARPPGMTGKDICFMHVLNNSSGKLPTFTYTIHCVIFLCMRQSEKRN